MAGKRAALLAAIRAHDRAVGRMAGMIEAELLEAIDDYLKSIADAVGYDPVGDPERAAELRAQVLAIALDEVKSNAEQLDEFQAERNAENDGDEIGFVYLGPDDKVTRPFCEVLVEKWFTRDEIDTLDNDQLPNVFVTRGGYNCRHGWYALFEGEEKEFTRGTQADIQRANDRARGA